MTTQVSISVNGDFKVPVKYKQGDREVSLEVSGKGSTNGPKVETIPFYHGNNIMTLEIGPETKDE